MGLMFVFPLAEKQLCKASVDESDVGKKSELFCFFFTPSISSIMDESHISASTGPSFTNAFLETCACSTKELFKIYVLSC